MKLLPLLPAATLALSATSMAHIITFDAFSTPAVNYTDFVPVLYQGFEFDGSVRTMDQNSDTVDFPSGNRALKGLDAAGYIVLRSLNGPFIFNRAEIAGAHVTGGYGPQADAVGFVAYRNGVIVAQQEVPIGAHDFAFHWYAGVTDQPIDTLEIYSRGEGQFANNVWLDALDVRPVPEPETWALLAVGAVGLLARRGRAMVKA